MPRADGTGALASWDASRQQQYRTQNPDKVLTFHFILDASPSMMGDEEKALKSAYAMYLGWLQAHADAMSMVEVSAFSTDLERHAVKALGLCKPLSGQDYNPRNGNGTALYRAVGEVCTTPRGTGQHILVVFTDGEDNTSEDYDWTASRVYMILKTLQEQQDWLCVFLGAFPHALPVGASMGFHDKNCLVFTSDQIPEAFQRLTKATEKYLAAPMAERKLLAAGGIF